MRTMFYGSNARTFRYAKKLRGEMTEEETILWKRLSAGKLNGFRFKRQHPVMNYIVDFYCHKAKLIIEVDGGFHFERQQIIRDRERSEKIEQSGCRIIRFTNDDIRHHLSQVLTSIEIFLKVSAGNQASPSGEIVGAVPQNTAGVAIPQNNQEGPSFLIKRN